MYQDFSLHLGNLQLLYTRSCKMELYVQRCRARLRLRHWHRFIYREAIFLAGGAVLVLKTPVCKIASQAFLLYFGTLNSYFPSNFGLGKFFTAGFLTSADYKNVLRICLLWSDPINWKIVTSLHIALTLQIFIILIFKMILQG